MRLLIALLALLGSSSALAASWESDFPTYLQKVVEENNLPGIAAAVVDADGNVRTFTYGYRDLERRLPVTPRTLYGIASTTKAFTGVILAQLRDQGLVDFDRPVQSYRPDFSTGDPEASRTLILRDLTGHWTGVGKHDLAWYHRGLTRAEMFATIPHLPVSAAPRTSFIYNNWMWVAAGVVAETVSGRSWESLLKTGILAPLGMRDTIASSAEFRSNADRSLPYKQGARGPERVELLELDAANPTGGIYSNVTDMAKWLQLHLRGGEFGGKRIVSRESLAETYKPYSRMTPQLEYAMGWGLDRKFGELLYSHNGGLDGYSANVSFMPSRGLGLVLLMNQNDIAPSWVAARLWQAVVGMELQDAVKTNLEKVRKAVEQAKAANPDPVVAPAARALEAYAGDYCHAGYGRALVRANQDSLEIVLPSMRAQLSPAGGDQFFIPGSYSAMKLVLFRAGAAGSVNALEWKLEDSVKDPVRFERCK